MNSDYFKGYENLEVHKIMLQDNVRNNAYKRAIYENKTNIKSKVVLDVGAGTGFLSVLCAQVGAAKVYAVEASEVAILAQEVVKENGFENIIQVINDRVEDIQLPEKVDILVSEWMGFYLLHEAMLDSVISARDKYLKPGGLMFPEFATVNCALCQIPSSYDFWENVSGVSMKAVGRNLRNLSSQKPEVMLLRPEDLLSEGKTIMWLPLNEITVDEVKSLKTEQVVTANKAGKYQGICIWFTVTFPFSAADAVTVSTGPEEPETHWKQTVLVLPIETYVNKQEPIAYEIKINKAEELSRRYNIEVTMLNAENVPHPEYCTCYMPKCRIVRAMLDKYSNNKIL